jgi:hypothetical protein
MRFLSHSGQNLLYLSRAHIRLAAYPEQRLDIQPVFLPLMAWVTCSTSSVVFIASNMVAAVQASKPRRTASFQPDLTPTTAIRWISVI